MGDKVGRSTLFGIPLQQTWSYENSGDFAPTYYLQSDPPLYYYSFTDAYIANAYLKLSPEQKKRIDPMITGFNPADMYAADHIRRVLETYPGVFTGIGEFTIHKEFVSSKVAGDTASLTDPARSITGFCRRGRARRHPAQRHRYAVCQRGCGAGLSDADEGAASPAPKDHDHLGTHRARPCRASGTGSGEFGRSRAQSRGFAKLWNRSWAIRHIATFISTFRGMKLRNTPYHHRKVSKMARQCSTNTRIASCSALTTSPRMIRRHRCGSLICGTRYGSSSPRTPAARSGSKIMGGCSTLPGSRLEPGNAPILSSGRYVML